MAARCRLKTVFNTPRLNTLGDWQQHADGTLVLWQKKEHLRVRATASAAYEVSAEKINEDDYPFTRIAIRLTDKQAKGWVKLEMRRD